MSDKNIPESLSSFRLFMSILLEPFIRLGGLLGWILNKDLDGIELKLRGMLLGGKAGWLIGRNVRFVGPSRRFLLGSGVTLYGNTYLNVNGHKGHLSIGNGSHIDQFCVLYGQGGMVIGDHCAIASGVIIYSQSNADILKDGTPVALQPTQYESVQLGNGCWLGAGVRILPGVKIGDNVHVGAGAVVTHDVPPNLTIVGVPARPLSTK